MVTGYEAGFYRNMDVIREETRRQTNALEKIADTLEELVTLARGLQEEVSGDDDASTT